MPARARQRLPAASAGAICSTQNRASGGLARHGLLARAKWDVPAQSCRATGAARAMDRVPAKARHRLPSPFSCPVTGAVEALHAVPKGRSTIAFLLSSSQAGGHPCCARKSHTTTAIGLRQFAHYAKAGPSDNGFRHDAELSTRLAPSGGPFAFWHRPSFNSGRSPTAARGRARPFFP